MTFNQVKEIGANVKKGEHGHIVVFSKKPELKTDENGNEEKTKPVLRYYIVFNISQCENIPEKYIQPLPEHENEPLQRCAELIEWMPNRPEIVQENHKAYYRISSDTINMPRMEAFIDSPSYYATLFHELIHSTGHQSRLDRKSLTERDMENYSIEELTAEIGACYLMSLTGIADAMIPNSAVYIESWLKHLKNDRKYIFIAASQAQKAVDYILGNTDANQVPETETAIIEEDLSPVDLDDLPF